MPDFPYINARVRAMHSRLLDSAHLEELLAIPTLEEFVTALAQTPYGPHLQEALTRYAGLRAVDEALARNFHQATTRILSFADGRARELIEVVLMRWDVANLRAILRGKHAGRPAEAIIGALLPAGALSEVALRELAAAADVPGVVGALSAQEHPLAPALAEGLADYRERGDLLVLELRLDRFYAAYGLRRAAGRGHSAAVLRRVLQAEIDATNVKTALKLQQASLGPDERARFYIPGGRLVDERLFLALSDPATADQGLAGLRLQGFPVRGPVGDLAAFERDLDLALLRVQAGLYRGDPLEIDIVIGYLAQKYNEVVNLRLIARGKALGIPRERVRQEMVEV
ncbi:MAG: V-type ATPase subunit [Armatimonadota bacterium]|nr:V-type ATPase subunit [Armatimonadota bacterium]